MPELAYIGNELELFQHAVAWKQYFSSRLVDFIGGRVLEVGAGLGANTALLQGQAKFTNWTCLEPDAKLAAQLATNVGTKAEVVRGTLSDLGPQRAFDTVLYIDVLEHIEDDRAEVQRVARALAPGGHLIVLSPAHGFLYSPFDREIGHFRRYDRKSLRAVIPDELKEVRTFYLDSVGFFASLANRCLLSQKSPTLKQIRFWDGVLVPLSRVSDPLLAFRFGKTVVGVWRKS